MTERRDHDATRAARDVTATVIEEAERNPAAARELAAARLATGIVWALNEALRVRGWQAKQLAAALGVGESAVSQVLNGDGNLRVATIGRYGRALGYQAKVVLEPVEPGLTPITEPAPRRTRSRGRVASEAQRVALPESGWQVVSTVDGATWGVQTTVSWPAPDRIIRESAYTRLEGTGAEPANGDAAEPLMRSGGGA